MPSLALPAARREAMQKAADPNDPLTVELNLEEPFRCVAVMPEDDIVALRAQATGLTNDQADTMPFLRQAMRAFIDESEWGRYDEGLHSKDPKKNISVATISEMYLALVEHYTGRPISPVSPSTAGQENTGNESSTTPDTPVATIDS